MGEEVHRVWLCLLLLLNCSKPSLQCQTKTCPMHYPFGSFNPGFLSTFYPADVIQLLFFCCHKITPLIFWNT